MRPAPRSCSVGRSARPAPKAAPAACGSTPTPNSSGCRPPACPSAVARTASAFPDRDRYCTAPGRIPRGTPHLGAARNFREKQIADVAHHQRQSVRPPGHQPRATRFGRYRKRSATAVTSSRVSARTPYSPFNARETVETFTPDSRATSLIVTAIDIANVSDYKPLDGANVCNQSW